MAKVDIKKIVTEKIIEGLKAGKIPWQKPWNDGGAVNHVKNRPYRGLNQLVLSYTADDKGWLNRWVSIGAIKDNGWTIKTGESPQYIAFFKWVEKKDDDGEKYTFPLLRYYKVWSLSQLVECDTIEIPEPLEFVPVDKAEGIISNMPNPPALSFGGNTASYDHKDDRVDIPLKTVFKTIEGYYSTMFHELAHSTGHESRLNRPGIAEFDRFGSEQYSVEELIAEMTAAFVCGECGIDNTLENTVAYAQSWLTVLDNDRQMILTAAGQAQKAADYIMGVTWDN